MSLVVIKSNADLDAEDLARAENDGESGNKELFISSLSSHIQNQWEINRDAKREVEQEMLASLRQRNGEYDAHTLAAIHEVGGSEIFMMLTATK